MNRNRNGHFRTPAENLLIRPEDCRVNIHQRAKVWRKFLGRNSMWPARYEANVRFQHPKTHKETLQTMSFLLPSEVLEMIVRLGDLNKIADQKAFEKKMLDKSRSLLPKGKRSDSISK